MTAPSPRQLAWRRRGAAFAAGWREFAKQRSGLVGLGLLGLIVLLALLAPVLTDRDGLDVTKATGGRAGPAELRSSGWAPTRRGRSVLLLTLWGTRISLLVGLRRRRCCRSRSARSSASLAAHFGGWMSAVLMRVTDFFLVLPSLVLAIALSTVLRARHRHDHPGDRR